MVASETERKQSLVLVDNAGDLNRETQSWWTDVATRAIQTSVVATVFTLSAAQHAEFSKLFTSGVEVAHIAPLTPE